MFDGVSMMEAFVINEISYGCLNFVVRGEGRHWM